MVLHDGSSEVPERTTPIERPPYWSDCENMDLSELERFLREAERKLTDSSTPDDGSFPRSQQEFLDLCTLMRAKVEAQKHDTTMPARPKYHGPEGPGPFVPSRELRELYSWLRTEEDQLYRAPEDDRVLTEYLEGQVAKLKARIAPIERKERQQHEERVREHERDREPYRRRLQEWQEAVSAINAKEEMNAKLEGFVDRAYQIYDRLFTSKRARSGKGAITVDFEILPPGEQTEQHVRMYYQEVLGRGHLKKFSQDRLDKMLALPWSGLQKGTKGFYGYIAITFDLTEKVLLECPVEDNAIYILNPGEHSYLKANVTKQDLLEGDKAKRIFHTGDWYRRLKDELGIE